MTSSLAEFLRDIAVADGDLDEREELAIDAVVTAIAQASPSAIGRLRNGMSRAWSITTDTLGSLAGKVGSIDRKGHLTRNAHEGLRGEDA